MTSIDDIGEPYRYYYENTPRFVTRDILNDMWREEPQLTEKDVDAIDILHLYRRLKIYTDLENINTYEQSNVYAYELALRTEFVKSDIKSAINLSGTLDELDKPNKDSWLNYKEVIIFENSRYETGERRLSRRPSSDMMPKRTFPLISVPADETEYLPIHLNMFLPLQELKAFLEAYIDNIQKSRKKINASENRDTIFSALKSNIKLIKPQNNISKDFKTLPQTLEKPNTNLLKIAEYFFSYDMVCLGFSLETIAQAIEDYRVDKLVQLNQDTDREDIEQVIASVDTHKTVKRWYDEIRELVNKKRYKNVVAPIHNSDLSMDDYISDNGNEIFYYFPPEEEQ